MNTAIHGTIGGYTNGRCRCQECRAAFAAYYRDIRARRRRNPIPDDVPHGTVSTYNNWMCRCQRCKQARYTYMARYR